MGVKSPATVDMGPIIPRGRCSNNATAEIGARSDARAENQSLSECSQVVWRVPWAHEIAGSIPVAPTKKEKVALKATFFSF